MNIKMQIAKSNQYKSNLKTQMSNIKSTSQKLNLNNLYRFKI